MPEQKPLGFVGGTIKPSDLCPFCLAELARGIPDNGICGHEEFLAAHPEYRFNAPSAPTKGE